MKLAGVKKEKKCMTPRFAVYLIGLLVMSFVLAHFLVFTSAATIVEGFVTVFWLWLGFIAPISIGSVLWEKKSIKLFLLNNVYNLISLGIMSAILISWK